MSTPGTGYLPRERFATLLDALRAAGYRVVGPRVRDGAVVYDDVAGVGDLPRGVREHQAPGVYRLTGHADQGGRLFAWSTGPQALKPLLFPARETLWRARRAGPAGLEFEAAEPHAGPVAVLGARACDLAALALHDLHFLDGPYRDPHYAARRERLLVVAVNCSHPADTCFCASTGDGPHARHGFDLALTELGGGFVVHVSGRAGRAVAERLALEPATAAHVAAESEQASVAAAAQVRSLPGRDLRAALFDNLEHPRWEDVAARCLACGNCTSVCPTCFCHAEAEAPSLGGEASEHVREWDSCFTLRHCQMHGYKVRAHVRQRYRQWLTHKLGAWHDQYGRSGCVGCGRCIAWCPAGIDLTEEAGAICAGAAA